MERAGKPRHRRASPRGRMSWEDHESKRMEPAASGATWTGSPKGVFAGRKHHKSQLALNNNTAGVHEPSEWSGGPSDIEGKTTRVGASEWSRGDASDIDGQTERSNGASGKSDIEGKAAMGSGERAGKRTSFKWAGAHESTWATNEFQSH